MSPQLFAYQEEALLALRRQEEAEATLRNAPKFDVDASTKFFGGPSNAYFLAVRAQVDMAAGRFKSDIHVHKIHSNIHAWWVRYYYALSNSLTSLYLFVG